MNHPSPAAAASASLASVMTVCLSRRTSCEWIGLTSAVDDVIDDDDEYEAEPAIVTSYW